MSGNTPYAPVDSDVSPALLPLAAQQPVNLSTAVTVDQPGAELAYQEFTSAVSVTATTEGTADTVVTAAAVDFDGAKTAIVEFFAPSATNPAGAAMQICLFDNGSSIGQAEVDFASGSIAIQLPIDVHRRLTPSAGSHTYSARAFVASGTGTVSGGGGGSGNLIPGFIRVVTVS